MEIAYKNKKKYEDILNNSKSYSLNKEWKEDVNKLILGENLTTLKTLLVNYNLKSKFDLIYIDPPFSTNTTFRISDDRASTISMASDAEEAYKDNLSGSDFLEFLRERLIIAKELLSDKGSIYLHIDYKIGHYVKIIMDEVFGMDNFRNDITRVKCNPKNFERKAYGNIKDMILFYTKTNNHIWNKPSVKYSVEDIVKLFPKTDEKGRKYTTVPLHAPGETKSGKTSMKFKGISPPKGRHWRCSPEELDILDKNGLIEWSCNNVPRKKVYADEKDGKKMQDIWEFKDPQYPDYPTQKNIDLLKSIMMASSNKDSYILDFFCGSGTTLIAAEELGRRWVGIDQSKNAVKIAKKRLESNKDLYSMPFDYIEMTTEA
ncbi:MAG: site-specific DNA-methyltransferase [Alphaproteobacteria bacterium]